MIQRNLVLVGGDVVTPGKVIENGVLEFRDGVISEVSDAHPRQTNSNLDRINCHGKIIMPGFIDVHTHGGVGLDFADEDPDTAAELSRYYFSHGTTTLLATLHSLPLKLLIPALERLAAYCRESSGTSNIIGIHAEGPFINKTQRGANQESYIETPNEGAWKSIIDAGGGFIRLTTVAPELPGIDSIIHDAIANNIVVSSGHSNANGETAKSAFSSGTSQITHLFNAMPSLHHRTPGLLAEALLSDRVDAQLIADGIHVHPDILKIAIRLKGAGHIMLITDSIRAAQLMDGEYDVAGNQIRVENGISKLKDGTIAGSTLVFEDAVRMVVERLGVDFPAASLMASLNAARSLGIDNLTGSIEKGKAADVVVLDRNFKVWMTIHHGTVRYAAFPEKV